MRNQDDFKLFLDLCLETKTISRLEALFDLFLTIEEKEHLASRVKIIRTLMDEQLSQRQISKQMQVSISQITRGSNALKIAKDDLLTFIEQRLRIREHE